MDGSYSSKLQLWEGWLPARRRGPAPPERVLAGPHHPEQFAERLFAAEALQDARPGRDGAEPFTLQWFLDVENVRLGRHGRWVPRLLEFAKHRGEVLLGLGNGLGTDWAQYARNGAEVVVCSPSAEQLGLVRRNFGLRGLGGAFLHSSPAALPLESATIDVACVSNLLHEVEDPRAAVEEVYRVLKPGGKVLALAPARYDVDFWCRRCLPWYGWRKGPAPAGARFSGRGLRRLFGRFVEPRIYKRHLRRADVPHLWRWVPLPLLERLYGRYLVIKAFKPLSAAMAVPLAA
jgi:ubiquinone/menaquinone biosynthesis C-methylase UbiE